MSLLGKRSICDFQQISQVPKKRKIDENCEIENFLFEEQDLWSTLDELFDIPNEIQTPISNQNFQTFQLDYQADSDFLSELLSPIQQIPTTCSSNQEDNFSELLSPIQQIPTTCTSNQEDKRKLASIQVFSRKTLHSDFIQNDHLKIEHNSLHFLQSFGKQRLFRIFDIESWCTSISVNLIGNGAKFMLKNESHGRQLYNSLVFDNIDGLVEFYLKVDTKLVDNTPYNLEVIFHYENVKDEHRVFIADIRGAGHKYETGKKILALRATTLECIANVILNEESVLQLEVIIN